MYTNHSASDYQIAKYGTNEDLGGLFKSIGKVFKGAAKIAGKVAAPALGFAIGGPAFMAAAAAAQSPNQPYTGTAGVAVTGADALNQRIQQLEYGQAQRQSLTGSQMPGWVLPVGLAAAGGLALILILRK